MMTSAKKACRLLATTVSRELSRGTWDLLTGAPSSNLRIHLSSDAVTPRKWQAVPLWPCTRWLHIVRAVRGCTVAVRVLEQALSHQTEWCLVVVVTLSQFLPSNLRNKKKKKKESEERTWWGRSLSTSTSLRDSPLRLTGQQPSPMLMCCLIDRKRLEKVIRNTLVVVWRRIPTQSSHLRDRRRTTMGKTVDLSAWGCPRRTNRRSSDSPKPQLTLITITIPCTRWTRRSPCWIRQRLMGRWRRSLWNNNGHKTNTNSFWIASSLRPTATSPTSETPHLLNSSKSASTWSTSSIKRRTHSTCFSTNATSQEAATGTARQRTGRISLSLTTCREK